MAIAQSPGERMTSAEQRRLMVDRQVRTFDVTDQIVIGRMLDVPRELFVDDGQRALAYSDSAVIVTGEDGRRRTLLTPLVLGRMLQAAAPKPDDRALDVEGATGYTAALLAGLVKEVVALESDLILSSRAKTAFATLGLTNVEASSGVASTLPTSGAFDIIVVNGCAEDRLGLLASRLAPGGRMVAIVRKESGSLSAALVEGREGDLSIRPLFDAQGPVLDQFRPEPTFVF